jgi:hypothetical protein
MRRRLTDRRQAVRAVTACVTFLAVVPTFGPATVANPLELHSMAMSMFSGETTPNVSLSSIEATARDVKFFFLFSRSSAKPGDRVTVRSNGTPRDFSPQQGIGLFQKPIRLYLVANTAARKVRSRFDSRVFFIGVITLDSRGRGMLTFSVPPLASDSYAIAGWCFQCGFFVQAAGVEVSPRYRRQAFLRVSSADPARVCFVTLPNASTPPGLNALPNYHGNGMLWALLPGDGVYRLRAESDGTFFAKIPWVAAGTTGELRVSAQRIDAPAPTPRTQTVPGSLLGFRGPSWAARVWFTSEGCWKVTGRIGDVSLIFIARVARAEGG